jgi:hypothetical protein
MAAIRARRLRKGYFPCKPHYGFETIQIQLESNHGMIEYSCGGGEIKKCFNN